MKVHRMLAEASAALARGVFDGGRVLDRSLAAVFSEHPKWGKRDRAFVAETAFEVVRWRRALAFVADSGEVEAMCAAQWRRMGCEVPDWWRHAGANAAEMEAREAALATQPLAVRESLPDWLDQLAGHELGAAWAAEAAALNRRAPVFLRANRLKNDRVGLRAWLASHQVTACEVAGLPDAVALAAGRTLPKALLASGRFEIQDAGSQLIAPWLDPQPGERVIDSCAGAGGKTLHLAALMGNAGRIDAFDVSRPKLAELSRRAKRAGVTCARTGMLTGTTSRELAGRADRLLIDAPCSGLGTLRRQPDLKWRLTPRRLEEVRAIQRELLGTLPVMLRPGGRLVYATCSILPSENHAAVARLLDRGGFRLVEEHQVSPATTGFDGFYAAVLTRDPDGSPAQDD